MIYPAEWLEKLRPEELKRLQTRGQQALDVMEVHLGARSFFVGERYGITDLWCLWSDGSNWSWLNMGKPQGVNLRAMLGAVTVMDTRRSTPRLHVFAEGNDYNVWSLWSNR